jgi:hypothetical protein
MPALTGDSPRAFARAVRSLPPFADLKRCRRDADLTPYQAALVAACSATDRSRAFAALLAAGAAPAGSSRKAQRLRAAAIEKALDSIDAGPAADGFELLAGLSLLLHEPHLADDLFRRLWHSVWNGMQAVLETSPRLAGRLTADQRALLLGELPWTYSIVFAGVRGARQARARGAEHLRSELAQSCDSEGIPQAALLHRLPLILAPLTRAAATGAITGDDWRDRDARRRYRQFVLRTAALLQPHGNTALSNGVVHEAASLLQTAAPLAGLKKSHRAALLATMLTVPPAGRSAAKLRHRTSVAPQLKRKHRPSAQSDAAQLACLRNNWGVGADACIIAFDGPTPRIDLTAFGVPVLSGEWGSSTATGQPVSGRAATGWECVCWFSGSTADYVELQRTAADGTRQLRQALLSRDDHFLFLCDVVHAGADGGGIRHTVTLPLQPGTTCDWCLSPEWAVAAVPTPRASLGLPQERSHRARWRPHIDGAPVALPIMQARPCRCCSTGLPTAASRRCNGSS